MDLNKDLAEMLRRCRDNGGRVSSDYFIKSKNKDEQRIIFDREKALRGCGYLTPYDKQQNIIISDKGLAALERYERELLVLKTAEDANKKSKIANKLSVIAIVVSSVLGLAAIISSILINLR